MPNRAQMVEYMAGARGGVPESLPRDWTTNIFEGLSDTSAPPTRGSVGSVITTTRLSSRISGRRKALCSETVSFENRPSNRWATGERREPCCVTPLRPSRPCRCAEHPLAEGARVMFLDTHKAITTIPITGMSVSAKARFRAAMWPGGARAARGSNDRLVLADGSDIPIRKPDPNNTGPGYTGAVPTFGEVGERQYGTSYAEMVKQVQDKATRDLRAMIKTLGR